MERMERDGRGGGSGANTDHGPGEWTTRSEREARGRERESIGRGATLSPQSGYLLLYWIVEYLLWPVCSSRYFLYRDLMHLSSTAHRPSSRTCSRKSHLLSIMGLDHSLDGS